MISRPFAAFVLIICATLFPLTILAYVLVIRETPETERPTLGEWMVGFGEMFAYAFLGKVHD